MTRGRRCSPRCGTALRGHWLTTLASELRDAKTRDWRWWQLARHTLTARQILLTTVVVVVLVVGLVVVLATSKTCWPAFVVASLWLRARRRLPFRLMGFLDDAYRLGLLRIVGPVYQFRHAALQDTSRHWLSRWPPRPSIRPHCGDAHSHAVSALS